MDVWMYGSIYLNVTCVAATRIHCSRRKASSTGNIYMSIYMYLYELMCVYGCDVQAKRRGSVFGVKKEIEAKRIFITSKSVSDMSFQVYYIYIYICTHIYM